MKKGTAITFTLGVFAGLTLCGPAAQASTSHTATLSSQPIYVNGRQVSMSAYQIGGNNYVKLRDVGEAVGFNVYWDGRVVQVESDQPYTGAAPAGQITSSAQQSQTVPTEKAVQAVLMGLRAVSLMCLTLRSLHHPGLKGRHKFDHILSGNFHSIA